MNTTVSEITWKVVTTKVPSEYSYVKRFINYQQAYSYYLDVCADKGIDIIEQTTGAEMELTSRGGYANMFFKVQLLEDNE